MSNKTDQKQNNESKSSEPKVRKPPVPRVKKVQNQYLIQITYLEENNTH